MKLTIGMIVKNEEKYLEKCLTAIKPILDSVESELIITDTGSTDKTVEIAERFTDKVLHFDWCDDFSAARNFGLEKAAGEWFMMLDADDIFRSCDNIIEFFNSGDYKNYNAATYISRNFIRTEGGVTYNDLLVPRMVRLTPQTIYEYPVHESLTTFLPPYKNIDDIADHYGYLYEDDAAKQRKFERNTPLLLKRLETEKDSSPMLYVQLYESYVMVEKYDDALKFLDDGARLCEKLNSIVLVTIYAHKADLLHSLGKFSEAADVCRDYFNIDKKIRPYILNTDAEIYACLADSLYNLAEYEDAVDAFKCFLGVYNGIKEGKVHTYDAYLMSYALSNDINIIPFFNEFADSCIKLGDLDTIKEFMTGFPLGKYSFEPAKMAALADYEANVLEHFSYEDAPKYARVLDELGKRLLINALCFRVYSDRERVMPTLYALSENDEVLKIRLSVYEKYFGGTLTPDELYAYTQKYGCDDLLYIALDKGFGISLLLASPDFDPKLEAYNCCKKIDGMFEAAERNMKNTIDCDPDSECELFLYITEMSLLSETDKAMHFEKLFSALSDVGLLCRSENTSGCYSEGAVKCAEIRELRQEKKYSECLSQIKKAITEHEAFAAIIAEYGRLTAEEYSLNNDPAYKLRQLSEQLKRNIRALISAGEIEKAAATLSEYAKIDPKDPDIPELQAEIKAKTLSN